MIIEAAAARGGRGAGATVRESGDKPRPPRVDVVCEVVHKSCRAT
jgi:hypothetical protein